mmetsp:Transcript_67414/g.119521  ORF Transcript_67414/g.119521 Transcript_67414/m.119521 type:complete len:227 (-) Transcript_67414:756-1436(-)
MAVSPNEVQAYKGTLTSDADSLVKLAACYKLVLLYHSQPFAALSNLSVTLNDPRVIKFLSQYSWSAEPSAQLTLQLLGYMAGSSLVVRKAILATEGLLGGMLGMVRGAKHDPSLLTGVIQLLAMLGPRDDARRFGEALGEDPSLITILAGFLSQPAHRHLRKPILELLLSLAFSPSGQQALWGKQQKVKDALEAIMSDADHPLSKGEAQLATAFARDVAALYLVGG